MTPINLCGAADKYSPVIKDQLLAWVVDLPDPDFNSYIEYIDRGS